MDSNQKENQEKDSLAKGYQSRSKQGDLPGVAIYLRLSRQDEDVGSGKDESNSIENQRKLLLNYIDAHSDLTGTIYEYADDGRSGASFSTREAFMQMIEDAKWSVFDTIIVKDFSRLGRDYIGVADYVERIFPLLGIRFISVNNHFDSGSSTGASMDLGLALENLINTFYLQDSIKKRRTADEIKWKKGYATAHKVPYGYYWDTQMKGKWNLDPVSSKYVRYIFDLALEGNSTGEIARVLNEEGIPTPNVYGVSRMKNRTQGEQNLLWAVYPAKAPEEEQLWTTGTVRSVLKRYEYTGALVMNKAKTVKSAVTEKSSRNKLPESEHIVAEGAHEAIVTVEEFERAQEVIRSITGRKKIRTYQEYLLKGKVRCGNCRRMMRYRPRSCGGAFQCIYKEIAGDISGCSNKRYPEADLNGMVLNAIERVISVAQVLEVKLESRNLAEEEHDVPNIKHIETQIRVMKEERIRQYEGYADGMITRQEYLAKKQKIDGKIAKLEAELEEARELLAEEQRIIEEIKRISNAEVTAGADGEGDGVPKPKTHVLTRAMVEAFIDSVYVYDPEHIEIVFKCEDVIKEAIDRTSGGGRASGGREPHGVEPTGMEQTAQ